MTDTVVKTVLILLNGKNSPTLKIHCVMALKREDQWTIVYKTKMNLGQDNVDARKAFLLQGDH